MVTALTFVLLSLTDGKAQTPENTGKDQNKSQVIRLAKLQIDSAYLESYKAALKEEIETSVRIEPGVLTYMQFPKKIIQPTLQFLKFTQIQMPIMRTGKHLILKNTKVPRRIWSSRLNLSR